MVFLLLFSFKNSKITREKGEKSFVFVVKIFTQVAKDFFGLFLHFINLSGGCRRDRDVAYLCSLHPAPKYQTRVMGREIKDQRPHTAAQRSFKNSRAFVSTFNRKETFSKAKLKHAKIDVTYKMPPCCVQAQTVRNETKILLSLLITKLASRCQSY